MKRLLLTLLASGSMIACSPAQDTDQPTATLKGTVENPKQEGYILLEEIWNNKATVVDTVDLAEDNTFTMKVKVDEPDLYRLNFYNAGYLPMILDEGDEVSVSIDLNDRNAKPEIKGSKDTDYLMSYSDLMQEKQVKINELNNRYRAAVQNGEAEEAKKVQAEYMAYEDTFSNRLMQNIDQMGTSVAAFYALNTMDWEKNFEFADKVTQKFKAEKPDSKYTKLLEEKAKGFRTLAVGSMAPEISLPNPEGEEVKLSSLRGKYVLLDFWASWCGPCRRENPNVVRMYNKYHDQGFEIYSVSLDKKKEKWEKAIQDDNLTWTHVSDLKHFNSEAAATYQINAIPYTLLLDKEGKIIAKNLRGAALERKLAEIFGE